MKKIIIAVVCFLRVWAVQHPDGFVTVDELPAVYFLEEETRQFVVTLEGGVVVNEGGIVTAEGKILKDTETYLSDQQQLLKEGRNIAEENPGYFDGRLAVISSPGQENWYHWLFQVLPRLKILADSGVQYDKIYLNNLKFPWQRQSLEIVLKIMGIEFEKLLLVDGDTILEATHLIVPSVPFIPSVANILPAWLTEFIHHCFLKEGPETPQKIYISRAKARCRRIINEEEFVHFLKENGFETFYLEELSVYDQARLFRGAEIIISPHGSGLANLIFAKPGTTVIEIDHKLPDEDQRSFYKSMAEMMQCHYHPFYVDEVKEEDLEKDLCIDIGRFPRTWM